MQLWGSGEQWIPTQSFSGVLICTSVTEKKLTHKTRITPTATLMETT